MDLDRNAGPLQVPEAPEGADKFRTFWENVAETTRWGRYITEIEHRAVWKAHQFAPEPANALDIGCEGGRWSKLLSDAGWNMACIDVDVQLLRVCQSRIPNARCILVKPEERGLPCETASLGLVLCMQVPNVLPDSDWFVAEACRVLRPGGLLAATFFNLCSYRGLIAHCTAGMRGSRDFYRFAYARWRRKLQKAGFTFLHQEGYCWFPFRRASNSPLVPLAVRTERAMGLSRLVSLSPWIVFVARKKS